MATASVYRAIADPTRRKMLDLLRVKERTVTELGAPFRISQPAVSQHLRVLRRARLVAERRAGRERYYRLTPAPLTEVGRWISHYADFWSEAFVALEKFLDEEDKG